jgi:hypothetical protein
MRVCSVCLSRSPNESFTTERAKKASLKRRVKFVARKSVKNTRSSFPSKDDVVSPTKDTQRARTISFDIRAEEERDVRAAAAALRARCFRTSFEERWRRRRGNESSDERDEASLRRAYFEKLVQDELHQDALLPARTERMALVVPRSAFLSQSFSSSSSSSFEIEDEYLVVERRADEMGEEEHKENQDEDTALVVVATLDYVIADKLQGELLCGDKGNGQSFDSEKYAFNEATQTYEFMPKTIERAYCSTCAFLARTEAKELRTD